MNNPLDKEFVFVIGAPRSGTTWLQAMIGAHPSVCTTVELMFFNLYTSPLANAWEAQVRSNQTAWPEGLPTLWTEDEFYSFLTEFLQRVFNRVLETKPQATVLLDKHPGYSAHVKHINRLLPHAKFIHLIRDGRDVVASLLEASSKTWGDFAPKRVESAAAMWKRYVLRATEAQQYTQRYLEVRYEALLGDGPNVLKSVFDFIGLPTDIEVITSIVHQHQIEKMRERRTVADNSSITLPQDFFRKGEIGDWQNELHAVQRYVLNDTAGDLLRTLGYSDDSWWIEAWYQYFTLPFLSIVSAQHGKWRETRRAIKYFLGPKWTTRVHAARARFKVEPSSAR